LKLSADATPLDGLRAVYTNAKLPLNTRLKAMVEAAPFVHPKLAVSAQVGMDGKDFAVLLDARLKRNAKVLNGEQKAIEASKIIEAEPTDVRPRPATNDRRYRRT
jgi:hypothetical protein